MAYTFGIFIVHEYKLHVNGDGLIHLNKEMDDLIHLNRNEQLCTHKYIPLNFKNEIKNNER